MTNFLDAVTLSSDLLKRRMQSILESNVEEQWRTLDDFELGYSEHPMLLSETFVYTGFGLPDVEFIFDMESNEYQINNYRTDDKEDALNLLVTLVDKIKEEPELSVFTPVQ